MVLSASLFNSSIESFHTHPLDVSCYLDQSRGDSIRLLSASLFSSI